MTGQARSSVGERPLHTREVAGSSPAGPTRFDKRRYQRDWLRRRREAWLADKSCVHCGSRQDLHIHHCDPNEKFEHRVWSWRQDRREAELAKCEVLCHPCHRRLHAEQDRYPCGTVAAYRRGCRCEPCRDAKRHSRVSDGREVVLTEPTCLNLALTNRLGGWAHLRSKQ